MDPLSVMEPSYVRKLLHIIKKNIINIIDNHIDMNRYCMPDDTALLNSTIASFKTKFYDQYHVDKFTDYISDLYSVWYVMVICIGVAFVFGFIYMFILKCCAGIIMFFSLVAIFLIIAGGGVWAYETKNNYDTSD